MPNPDPTTFQPPPPLIKEEVFTDPLQKWYAPFTPEQVNSLQDYPFCCELLRVNKEKPEEPPKSCGGKFTAGTDGLHCEKCKNTQAWASVVWRFRFIAYPDFTLQAPLQAKRDEYYSTYCDTEDGKLPAKLPPMGEGANRREVVFTWEITQAIALLEVMQSPEEEADWWNFNTWAYFYLAAPNAFEAAANFAGEMIGEAKGKNLPSPDTASVSGHSSTTDNSTRQSMTLPLLTSETPVEYCAVSP